jgi:hypothetical protein
MTKKTRTKARSNSRRSCRQTGLTLNRVRSAAWNDQKRGSDDEGIFQSGKPSSLFHSTACAGEKFEQLSPSCHSIVQLLVGVSFLDASLRSDIFKRSINGPKVAIFFDIPEGF